MNQAITISKPFQKLFGKKSKKIEIVLTLLFTLASTIFLFLYGWKDFQAINVFQIIVVAILMVDMSGGVISNFTASTNSYYNSKKQRYTFLAIHVQPLLLAVVLNDYYLPCILIWFYTVVTAFIVDYFEKSNSQKLLGAFFMSIGILILFLVINTVPVFVSVILLFFIIKLTLSFAVNHYPNKSKG